MNSNENSHLFDDINKKHEDASFIREQKKRAKEIEKLKKDRLKLESYYSNHYSLKLDIKIFFKTFKVVLFGKGAK